VNKKTNRSVEKRNIQSPKLWAFGQTGSKLTKTVSLIICCLLQLWEGNLSKIKTKLRN